MKFRLATIAYVFALLAAAMAVFGAVVGIWVSLFTLGFWAWVYAGPSSNAVGFVVGVFLLLLLASLLLPAASSARWAARMSNCHSNLTQISLALRLHAEKTGRLPSEATYDPTGVPLMSWRVAILPYLEQQSLHAKLRMSEPWNSRANARWTAATEIDSYRCPAHITAPRTEHYFAVVGDQTAWPKKRGRTLAEITDDPALTILVLEGSQFQSSWAEPAELSMDQAIALLTSTPDEDTNNLHEVDHGFFYKPSWVLNAGFVDGSVRSLDLPLSQALALALLTVDGGEEIDDAQLDEARVADIDYGRCYAFAAFMALALWPGRRLRSQAGRQSAAPEER